MQEQNIAPSIPGAVSLRLGDFEKEPKTHVRLGEPTWEEDAQGDARARRCGQPMKPEEVEMDTVLGGYPCFIYVGDHSAGDPRSLSESGPHGSRRDPVRGPRLE
jgi:hypothetical protein